MRISDWSSDVCSSDLPTMERSSKAECWEQAQDAETETGSRQLLAVDGLFCGGCARGLEQRLRKLEGVLDAGVHYLTALAFIHWNPRLCSLPEIDACNLGRASCWERVCQSV